MDKASKSVCVVGLGYIGLPTASLLATKGFSVRGVDVSARVVETINRGEIHIYEPDLDVLVKSAVQSGRLTAATAPSSSDIFVIAVPTPFREDHVPDISYVEAATRTIAADLAPGNLVILESTSPVGTTEQVAKWIREERPDLRVARRTAEHDLDEESSPDIYVAHCPERVLPGHILRELVENDRIVGGIDEMSTQVAARFYEVFVAGRILTTDSRTAELAKLTENTFRDVNIALANELSRICDRLQVNVWELISLANHHPRVNILKPGPGVGGHCIAVDPWFIVDSAPEEAQLIRTARTVNDGMPQYVVNKVKAQATRFDWPKIACFGLSYKANIDDLRESPAVKAVGLLAQEGVGEVCVVEPHIVEAPSLFGDLGVRLVSEDVAIRDADILVLLVDHDAFRMIDRQTLKEKVVVDTRGIWQ